MTPRRRRLVALFLGLGLVGSAAALALRAFDDSLVFFVSPSELAARPPVPGRPLRIGGLVEAGSVQRGSGLQLRFTVTDGAHRVAVAYAGLLPDLFQEGKGVVAQGRLQPDGSFLAEQVLARHDENYMPPEAAAALKAAAAKATP